MVVGGGREVGLAVATTYAEAGAKVHITPSISSSIKLKQSPIPRLDRDSLSLTRSRKTFGKLDMVIANAGICFEYIGAEYTPEGF